MAEHAEKQAPTYWERLRDSATQIALEGASRYIDAEIVERANIQQPDLSPGVDQGQQRIPQTDASQGTIGAGGSLAGYAVLGIGAVLIYLAVK